VDITLISIKPSGAQDFSSYVRQGAYVTIRSANSPLSQIGEKSWLLDPEQRQHNWLI